MRDREWRFWHGAGMEVVLRFHLQGVLINIPISHLDRFLEERQPRVPDQLQLEIDFGEGFNFWWYDDEGVLWPNEWGNPKPYILEEDEDHDPYNEDFGYDYDDAFDPDYDDIPF